MELELIAIMGTAIAGLAAAVVKLTLDQRNNIRPRDGGNPHAAVDLHTIKLGDMSASWFEEKHEEIINQLKLLRKAVRGEEDS